MMDFSPDKMIEAFTHRQLMQAIHAGGMVGFTPITIAASMMQMCASLLVSVSPHHASAVLRAYADLIDAGPVQTPQRDAAISRFMNAGEQLIAAAQAARDFPQPQGRA